MLNDHNYPKHDINEQHDGLLKKNQFVKSFINKKRIIKLEEFNSGSSHSLLLLMYSQHKKYICKIIFDNTLAGNKRCILHEYRALKIVNSLGMAPKPISYNSKEKALIMEFVEHENYNVEDLNSVLMRANLAAMLANINCNHKLFYKRHYDFRIDFQKHKMLLNEITLVLSKKDITELTRLWKASFAFCLLYNTSVLNSNVVFSHNDLVGGNVLFGTDRKKYIIDFETVGFSTYDFIIGQIAVDAEIDWFLYSTKQLVHREELYQLLIDATGFKVNYEIFIARMVERFVQNMIYGMRQISIYKNNNKKNEYIKEKKLVVKYCVDQLNQILYAKT